MFGRSRLVSGLIRSIRQSNCRRFDKILQRYFCSTGSHIYENQPTLKSRKLPEDMKSAENSPKSSKSPELVLQERTRKLLNSLPLEHLRHLESMGPTISASILACPRLYTLIMYQESRQGQPGEPKEWYILDAPFPDQPKEDRALLLTCRLLADELVCTNNTFPYIYHPKKMVLDMLGDEHLQALIEERASVGDMNVTLLTRNPKLGDTKYVERVDPSRSSHPLETGVMKFQLFTSADQAKNLFDVDPNTGLVQNRDWTSLNSRNCKVMYSRNGGIQEYFQSLKHTQQFASLQHQTEYRRFYIEGGTHFLVSYLKEMAQARLLDSDQQLVPALDTFLLTSRVDVEEQHLSKEELVQKRKLSFSNDLALTPELLAAAGYVPAGLVPHFSYPTANYYMTAYIYAGKGDADSQTTKNFLDNRVQEHEEIYAELQQIIREKSEAHPK